MYTHKKKTLSSVMAGVIDGIVLLLVVVAATRGGGGGLALLLLLLFEPDSGAARTTARGELGTEAAALKNCVETVWKCDEWDKM